MKKLFDKPVHLKELRASKLNGFQPRQGHGGRKIFNLLFYPFLMIALLVQNANAQARIGYVFEINGEWVLNGQSRSLARSDAVPAGGVIRFRRASFGNSYILIADRTGTIIEKKYCDREDCSRPIVLRKTDRGYPSALGRIFSAVMSFWRSSPEVYDAKIPRAGGILEESIVMLKDGKVDLSSVFKNKNTGRYLLRFVSKGRPRLSGLKQVVFDWDRSKQSLLPVPTLKSGLYEIELLSVQDRERLEPREEVWVLVMPPGKNYEATIAEFTKVRADSAQWNVHELAESRRSFLRAYLGYLNAGKKK
jgi:hypothetical protein